MRMIALASTLFLAHAAWAEVNIPWDKPVASADVPKVQAAIATKASACALPSRITRVLQRTAELQRKLLSTAGAKATSKSGEQRFNVGTGEFHEQQEQLDVQTPGTREGQIYRGATAEVANHAEGARASTMFCRVRGQNGTPGSSYRNVNHGFYQFTDGRAFEIIGYSGRNGATQQIEVAKTYLLDSQGKRVRLLGIERAGIDANGTQFENHDGERIRMRVIDRYHRDQYDDLAALR